ncbi:DDE-type integrase/transposase/recombinase [Streptomyces sp. DG1A-41]|uniref:DDE-type integrase/transposase/recombinase n=1 Tax=Streptomyces sp. DG1A-41 TaxID=3125779 RepID=UPI0030CD1B64
MSEVYAFIEAEKTTHHVALLCRLLKVARSSFYAWLAGEKTRRAKQAADDVLAHEITVLHLASRSSYGVPRIHAGLTRPAKRAVPAPDLIARDFTAPAPGMKLVGDITYIPTDEDWLYLATWLDPATREIVGYSMADHHRASLVVDALGMAEVSP